MGSGIAQVSAQAGFPTVVREVSKELLDKGLGSVFKFLQAGARELFVVILGQLPEDVRP